MSFSLLFYGIVWGTLVLTPKDLVEYISEYFQFWPFLCGEPLCYCFNLTDFLYEFFKIYFFVCMCVYLHLLACLCITCMQCTSKPEEGGFFHETEAEVTDSCEVTGTGCWKQNLGLLQDTPWDTSPATNCFYILDLI